MKLRNKKTGEIGYFCFANWNDPVLIIMDKDGVQLAKYNSLAEMNAEWEDVPEEPKESEHYWYIGYKNDIRRTKYHHISDFADNQVTATRKEIGNCFESLEEAEKAVEKLKALAEAKEDGLKIKGYYYNHEDLVILADIGKCNKLTLDTLFGKEID